MGKFFPQSKKHIIRLVIGACSALFFVFIATNVWPMVTGVRLSLSGLENGKLYSDSILALSGSAAHAIKLTVNGRELPVTRDGAFNDVLVLLPGYNVITIRAVDKFGNISEKKYEVIQRNENVAQNDQTDTEPVFINQS